MSKANSMLDSDEWYGKKRRLEQRNDDEATGWGKGEFSIGWLGWILVRREHLNKYLR